MLPTILFALELSGRLAASDCSLTSVGVQPLTDSGTGEYLGFRGGLYPDGSSSRPSAHLAAGTAIATNEIVPRDASGAVDPLNGSIVLVSVGMSNTTQEFSTFVQRAALDGSRNPQLVIVDGAQGARDVSSWTDPASDTWDTLDQRLAMAGVSPAQVQVVWVKQAQAGPSMFGAFPAHAIRLQLDLERLARNLVERYPFVRIAYFSSRTRAYVDDPRTLNPEPFAFESGFSVRWMIEDQLNGSNDLNYDPALGPVRAPWLSWGPYLWTDGENARSDGLVWRCDDLQPDFTHPSASGRAKVADQLSAFFRTDPTARTWYLRPPPAFATCTASASPSSGQAPLGVRFTASAALPANVTDYAWTFDDGTYATTQNPLKTFASPGTYAAHLTATDAADSAVSCDVTLTVTP